MPSSNSNQSSKAGKTTRAKSVTELLDEAKKIGDPEAIAEMRRRQLEILKGHITNNDVSLKKCQKQPIEYQQRAENEYSHNLSNLKRHAPKDSCSDLVPYSSIQGTAKEGKHAQGESEVSHKVRGTYHNMTPAEIRYKQTLDEEMPKILASLAARQAHFEGQRLRKRKIISTDEAGDH